MGCYSFLAQSWNVGWGQAWQGLRAAPRPACPEGGGGVLLTGGKLEGSEALLSPAWPPRCQVLWLGFDSSEESPPAVRPADRQAGPGGAGGGLRCSCPLAEPMAARRGSGPPPACPTPTPFLRECGEERSGALRVLGSLSPVTGNPQMLSHPGFLLTKSKKPPAQAGFMFIGLRCPKGGVQ